MTAEIKFILNNELVSIKSNPAIVLLDFIRKQKNLTGTKEGCKEGDCGACTVLVGSLVDKRVEYKPVNSCLLPIGSINNKHVVTIEGINYESFTPVQRGFIDEGASQCGFCTPGFIISLTGYIIGNRNFSLQAAENAIAGNICRCTGYTSIRRVLKGLTEKLAGMENSDDRIAELATSGFLPQFFTTIPDRLKEFEIGQSNGKPAGMAKFISGGTDLFVQMPDKLLEIETSLLPVQNLAYIKNEEGKCVVGAGTTFEMIKNSDIFLHHFPRLHNYMNLIASLPIRNSATVGGNIVNASPIGDMTIFFLALNSMMTIVGEEKSRKIFLRDFYSGYKEIDLAPGEYVSEIEFKLPGGDSYFNFEKVSKRKYLDIASANSAIYLEAENGIIGNAHVSAGGVSPVPLYLKETSEFLVGRKITPELVSETSGIIQSEISPISDVRGSSEYKRLLIEQLFKAHFIELFPEVIKMEAVI